MLTTVRPRLPKDELIKEEQATLERELKWLLNSLQETLSSLKSGLEECVALLEPTQPGSTLVISSVKSESVKGFITRVGTRVVKGDIQLRLQTLPPPRNLPSYPLRVSTEPTAPPLILTQLSTVRNLINQALDVVDISTWTGDPQDASFISGQLRLLFELLQEAKQTLKGGADVVGEWPAFTVDEAIFSPPLPSHFAITLTINEASILLTLRTIEHYSGGTPSSGARPSSSSSTASSSFAPDFSSISTFSLRHRLGLAPRPPEHDESDRTFSFKGRQVRVKEKVKVESQDPSLMAVMAKVSALEHVVAWARTSLAVVMGQNEDDE
ncbi:37S ribosomal protein S22 [Agyrium rufum]|nr:37S ribosomal protein S22 [Agyrium rufum]